MTEAKKRINLATHSVPLTDYLHYRDYLAAIYSNLKQQTAGKYSYQKFAVDLGFSFSNVIRLVITGQRKLTPKSSERIADSIGLIGIHRRFFLMLVRYNNARQSSQRETYFKSLLSIKAQTLTSKDHQAELEYYSEWYHPVIREMSSMAGFKSDPAWISAQLFHQVMPHQITNSLNLLERLSLIEFDPKAGRHRQRGGQITPTREVDNVAAVRCHQSMIDIAKESITRFKEEDREIHALTLSVSASTAAKIKQAVLRACEEIFAIEGAGTGKSQVLQLNIQLFPLTRSNLGGEDP